MPTPDGGMIDLHFGPCAVATRDSLGVSAPEWQALSFNDQIDLMAEYAKGAGFTSIADYEIGIQKMSIARTRVHVIPNHERTRFEEFLNMHGAYIFSMDPDPDGLAVLWSDAPGNSVDVSDYPSYVASFDQAPSIRMPRRNMIIQ